MRRDQIQLEIIINGKKGGHTLAELKKQSRNLNRELQQLTPGTDAFIKKSAELKKVNTRMSQVTKGTRAVRNEMSLARKAMNSFGPAVTVAFAVGAVARFFKAISDGVTKITHIESKFNIVFGSAANIVDDMAKKMAISLGLTRNEYKETAAAAGDLLIPMGFQREEAAKMSTDLVNLSGAMSAWSGGQKTAKDVSDILTKAMLGEREQLKTLGIAILDREVTQRVLVKGMSKLIGKEKEQARALATLELLYEKSADGQQSFLDSTNGLVQSKARILAKLRQVWENMSQKFIPVMTKGVVVLEQLVDKISGGIKMIAAFSKFVIENRVAILLLGVALVQYKFNLTGITIEAYRTSAALLKTKLDMYLMNATMSKGTIIGRGLKGVWKGINTAMRANPIGFVITVLSILGSAIVTAYNRFEKFRAAIDGIGNVAKEMFKILGEGLASFGNAWNLFKIGEFSKGFKEIGKGLLKVIPGAAVISEGKRLGNAWKKGFNESLEKGRKEKELADKEAADRAKLLADAKAAEELERLKKHNDAKKKLADDAAKDAAQKAKYGKVDAIPLLDKKASSGVDVADAAVVKSRVALLEKIGEAELSELERQFLKRVFTEEAYEIKRLEAIVNQRQLELELMRAANLEETDAFRDKEIEKLIAQKELSDQRIENAEREEDLKKQIREAGMDAFQGLLSLGIDSLKDDEKAKKKHGAAIKALEIANVGVNLESELSSIWLWSSKNPLNWATLGVAGQITAIAKSAFAIARAGSATSKIAKAKYYTGGYTGDGDMYESAGEVHRREIVFSQQDVANRGGVRAVEAYRQSGNNTSPVSIPGGGTVNNDRMTEKLLNKLDEIVDANYQSAKKVKAYMHYESFEDAKRGYDSMLEEHSI